MTAHAEDVEMSIHIDSCLDRETLVVTTRSSVYELIVLRGGGVLVRDRRHFTEFRRAVFIGSTAEGGPLDPCTIDIGLRMLFVLDDRPFITSAVESIFRPHVTAASMECAAAH
jgi:hypothetical protein